MHAVTVTAQCVHTTEWVILCRWNWGKAQTLYFKAYGCMSIVFGNVTAYVSSVFMLTCVCACIWMWNPYINIYDVLSSLPWLHLLLYIDRHSEFISYCDSFLPGARRKYVTVPIKSSDSVEAHNGHCVLITGQTPSRVECCSGIFYMRAYECVCQQ